MLRLAVPQPTDERRLDRLFNSGDEERVFRTWTPEQIRSSLIETTSVMSAKSGGGSCVMRRIVFDSETDRPVQVQLTVT